MQIQGNLNSTLLSRCDYHCAHIRIVPFYLEIVMGYLLKTDWWKWLCIALLVYTAIAGLLLPVPELPILNETIRVLHFPRFQCGFGMILLFLGSVVHAVKYLRSGNNKFDTYSVQLANMGIAFGVLGIVTGMIWANYTWGEPWSNDPKQNASAISLLIYLAYFVLRSSMQDEQQRNRHFGGFQHIRIFPNGPPLIHTSQNVGQPPPWQWRKPRV